MIKGLKDSSLLLDANKEGFVKMHDIVRDVAIWIGSKEEKFFNRAATGLTEWPEDEGLEKCRAISLLGNTINVLPNSLVCPNLHTLLLENYDRFSSARFLVISDQFFEGMTALKVVTIIGGDLSIKSLQFSTNLEVLQLIRCDVKGMAFLGKLKKLQILCLEMSSFDEIPDDMADELSKLKLLDLCYSDCSEVRISLIKRFSQLQEFYGRMTWEVEGTNAECLLKDFAFPQLQRYEIFIGEEFSYDPDHGRTNALSINNTEATSLIIFSALYQNVQYLCLEKVKGCQNILPNIDQRGLKELTVLVLCECEDLECIMDVSQHVKSQSLVMLSRLATLYLVDLQKLQQIWKAPAQHVDLQNLTVLAVNECNNLTYLFSLSQARSLLQLRTLEVQNCKKLEHIIEAKIDNNERRTNRLERDEYIIALPMLKELILDSLPNLTTFCSECYFPTWQALDELALLSCSRLTGNADEFVQAKCLTVSHCEDLECIMDVSQHVKSQNLVMLSSLAMLYLDDLQKLQCIWKAPAQHIDLRNLTEVEVENCNSLTYHFSLSQARSLVQLKKLKVEECEKLEHIIEAKIDNNERRKNILGGDEYTIALPMLEELALNSLPNLTTLSSECYFPTCQALQKLSLISCPRLTGHADEFMQAENLQYLCVERCYHLYDAIVALLKHGLKNLQELCIGDLGAQVVFQLSDIIVDGQESKLFPSFKKLSLYGLREMEVLYKGPTQFFCRLQNLTSLNVQDCNRLRHLLIPTLARNLLQLEYLSIHRCSELEQIIKEDEEEDHLPPICFPSLKNIDVRLCPKLKHLFHISMAPSLQNLSWLILEEVDELEEVFWHKDGAVVVDDNKIVMTKLLKLALKDLPNLTNCWPEGYQLTFPSLFLKTVENCPKLRTNFVEEELQTTSKEDASTVGDTSEERNINQNASTVGDASEDRNTNENASIVGDASKRGDSN